MSNGFSVGRLDDRKEGRKESQEFKNIICSNKELLKIIWKIPKSNISNNVNYACTVFLVT